MRIAFISDIHSNLEALTGVLKTIEHLDVGQIWCLGDIVGYGPFPGACVDMVRERCTVVLKGNHEAGTLSELPPAHFNEHGRIAVRWTKDQLTGEQSSYLKSLPPATVLNGITVAHATPHLPDTWRYILSWKDAREAFVGLSTEICFIGHTHVPVIVGENGSLNTFGRGTRYIVNVGSVGQPRDGNPKASFGLFDSERWTYENVRVSYDVEKTAASLMAAGLPDYLAQRLFLGV